MTKTIQNKTRTFAVALVLALIGLSGATPLFSQSVFAAPAVSVCASGCDYTTIQDGINNVDLGGTVNVQAGTYSGNNIIVNKPVTLSGAPGAIVNVPDITQTNGFNVQANNVTITGLTIKGPADGTSYLSYPWGGTVTRGIFVYTGYTNFAITNNVIQGLRNNILIDGRNTGSVTGNVIDNSKSGISVQYTDAGTGNTEGYNINISGNQEGAFGNEWGLNMHLNGHDSGGGVLVPNSVKIAANAPDAVQTALLANKANNGGWAVQDQGYSFQNRTEVAVATTGSDANQGSKLGPLATVQAGANAVTKNGVVTVSAGTYSGNVNIPVNDLTLQAPGGATLNLGSGFGINLNNGPVITGFKLTGFTVNASPTTTYALKAYKADGITIENSTFNGSTGNTGGLDFNTTSNITLNNVTANGFKKNGFAFTAQFTASDTPASNIALNGVTASNNGWAGIAFYNANGSGTVGANITGVTFSGSNSLTGNGNQGLFIEGDTDANFLSQATPRWTVTGPGGAPLNIGTTSFSTNGTGDSVDGDIVNYQTAGIQALSALFGGLTGDQMTASQRSDQDDLIIDKLDDSDLGLVKYWTTVVTVNPLSTDDTTPALSGTVNDPNVEVKVTVNGHTYTANVSSSANSGGTYDWNVGVADALSVGVYDVVATATDLGGNAATDGSVNELTINAPAPSGGGSGGGGSSSGNNGSNGSTGNTGGTTITAVSINNPGAGAGGFGAGVGQFFGDATAGETTTNDEDKGNVSVAGSSTDKAKQNDKDTKDSSSFLGLDWWWWLLILAAILAALYAWYRRRQANTEA